MEIPAHLYHYTNIDSLALILKNKTIRLNLLDKMDDLQEKETSDIKNIGQFYYVSSWTEDEVESIPMWNMYTKIDAGVRIKLKANPFKRHGTTLSNFIKLGYQVAQNSTEDLSSKIDTFLPIDELMKNNCYTIDAFTGDILKKITYTPDRSLLYPSIDKSSDEQISLELRTIGIFKNLHWSFQKEWRYILMFLPIEFGNVSSMEFNFRLMANRLRLGIEKQPFSYYDLHIAEDAFSQMEITLSPKISIGNKELILNTINKYNPKIQIKDSMLLGLI